MAAEEEWRRGVAVVAEAWWITEEKTVAAVRQRAILEVEAKHKAKAEEMEVEKGSGSLLKQKQQVEGKWVAWDHCTTWGFECKVSWSSLLFDFC